MQIIVSDDGPGVAESVRGQLGKRGLRLDEQIPGHGLGLAIVVDIVQRYDGEMAFSPGPEGGLQVVIVIRY